jgi:PIN domain nuclease of toxin-antitoxin system
VSVVHIDTHVAVWMYVEPSRLRPAAAHLEGHVVALSPMALLELQYLHEIGRLSVTGAELLANLEANAGLRLAEADWASVTGVALTLSWTRDPFDRLIAAQSVVEGVPLVTADAVLRAHLPNAVWI